MSPANPFLSLSTFVGNSQGLSCVEVSTFVYLRFLIISAITAEIVDIVNIEKITEDENSGIEDVDIGVGEPVGVGVDVVVDGDKGEGDGVGFAVGAGFGEGEGVGLGVGVGVGEGVGVGLGL